MEGEIIVKIKWIAHLIRNNIINPCLRKKIMNKEISIISSNCNGGIIYSDLGIKFNSPTINLFFYPKDFIKFLKKLDYYLNLELIEVEENNINYPIGLLGDIKIYFKHYVTFKDAKKKWNERKKRINKENIFIIFTDRDNCTYEDMIEFDNLNYENKIIFTKCKYEKIKSSFYIKGFENKESVGILSDFKNILAKRYIDQFDYIAWFNNKI